MRRARRRSERRDGEIVEVGDRVGPRPEADPAGVEGPVDGLEDLRAVPREADPVALHVEPDLVPRDAEVRALPAAEGRALAVLHHVEVHVAVDGAGAGEVVALVVLEADDEPAGLLDLAGDGLAADADPGVLDRGLR